MPINRKINICDILLKIKQKSGELRYIFSLSGINEENEGGNVRGNVRGIDVNKFNGLIGGK